MNQILLPVRNGNSANYFDYKHMMKFKTAHFIAGAIIISAVALPVVTMAHTGAQGILLGFGNKIHKIMPANNMVVGTVTTISGTTLTVTDAKSVVYTIDASAAKVDPGMMGASGLTVANILVGDKVVVTGPVNGTSETAKMINDRSMKGRNIFMGTVTVTNGSVLTIDSMTGKTKTSYTVDASSAALSKGMGKGTPATIAITDVKVGDRIFAIGTLSGTSVAATSVRDLGQTAAKKDTESRNKPANMFTGTVTLVNGSMITATGHNTTVYTINAGTAKLVKGMGKDAATITLADIKVGDRISAVGAVSGTNVAATSVRDLGQAKPGVHAHRGSGQK